MVFVSEGQTDDGQTTCNLIYRATVVFGIAPGRHSALVGIPPGCGRHSARRHSARSAFGPKRWSAFRPVGIQAASRLG